VIKPITSPLFSIFVIALSANLPVPLFPLYVETYSFTDLDLTLLFSLYGLFIFTSLLVSPSLTEKLGVEMMVLISLSIAVFSTMIFFCATTALQVFAARCLTGVSVGLFMGAGNALLIKKSEGEESHASYLSNILTILGFGISPLVTGIWAQQSSHNAEQIPYLIFLFILLTAFILHLQATRIKELTPLPSPLDLKIRIDFPKQKPAAFFLFICPCIFIMFSINGTLISLLPSYVGNVINSTNLAWSGLLIFVLLVGGAVAQHLPWYDRKDQRALLGIAALSIGAFLFLIAGEKKSIELLVVSIIIQAIGSGWTFQGSFLLASEMTTEQDRVGIISTYYLSGYLGTVTVPASAGLLTKHFSLFDSLSIIIAIAATITVFIMVNYRFIRSQIR
jgi:MFS family permease